VLPLGKEVLRYGYGETYVSLRTPRVLKEVFSVTDRNMSQCYVPVYSNSVPALAITGVLPRRRDDLLSALSKVGL